MAPNAAVYEFSGESRLPFLDGWRAVSFVMAIGLHRKVVHDFPTVGRDSSAGVLTASWWEIQFCTERTLDNVANFASSVT